jgi:hypothetical protein
MSSCGVTASTDGVGHSGLSSGLLLVDEVDNKDFLTGLFNAMYDELPMPKAKK